MIDFEKIGEIILLIYDSLKDDEQSNELIEILDSSESGADIIKTINLAIKRLIVLGKADEANIIKELMK